MYTATIQWDEHECPQCLYVGCVFENLDTIKKECVRFVQHCMGKDQTLNFDWHPVVGSMGTVVEEATFEASDGRICWVEIINVYFVS